MEFDDEIREFLIESNENLALLDQEIVLLEQRPEDVNLIASTFRTIHTIKGTCGFFGFVVTSTGQPLVVAGSSDGTNTGTSGTVPFVPGELFNIHAGAGGIDGNGGGAATLFGEVLVGGGGGFYTDGAGGSSAGKSFLNGGAGGLALTGDLGTGANGGYGGGSGSGVDIPGAGGGYSGGGGFGGAGGSYLDPAALNPVLLGGGNHGNGSIVITEENAPAPVPEPSSIVLLATGLLGAAGVLRRRHS